MSLVKLLGIGYDARSSFMRGAASAPQSVRRALASSSSNWCAESGRDLNPSECDYWVDIGDLNPDDDPERAVTAIKESTSEAIGDGSRLMVIGGDHLITWPVVTSMAEQHRNLTIVHFDAHPDLYDQLDGDRYSHACPFARIMEQGSASRLIQLGIRTMTPHQREQADRFSVQVVPMAGWDGKVPPVSGPVYVSVDIDVLDPAFVPGTSHHEPGGMSTRQLIDAIHQLADMDAEFVGADLVEINPKRDIGDMTAMVGAKLTKELVDLLIR